MRIKSLVLMAATLSEIMAKYGRPGDTDKEGFDPYTDSVGPGIYGGIVKRDDNGEIVIGAQFQGHNPNPGPVYAGGGYTPTSKALHDITVLTKLLETHPELANDVSTGGATPLHMCGMSRDGQKATGYRYIWLPASASNGIQQPGYWSSSSDQRRS